jgi:hypothetical protein
MTVNMLIVSLAMDATIPIQADCFLAATMVYPIFWPKLATAFLSK